MEEWQEGNDRAVIFIDMKNSWNRRKKKGMDERNEKV